MLGVSKHDHQINNWYLAGLISFCVNLILAVHEKAISKDAVACKVNVNGKIRIISVFRWAIFYYSAIPLRYIYHSKAVSLADHLDNQEFATLVTFTGKFKNITETYHRDGN